MRLVFGLVVAAALFVFGASAARAQVAPDALVPGAVLAPPVDGLIVGEAPVAPPVVPPYTYAAYMLPPAPSHPWVILPNLGPSTEGHWRPGVGSRTSPYGDYGRFAYFYTGTSPFPGVLRPYVWYDEHCSRHHAPVYP